MTIIPESYLTHRGWVVHRPITDHGNGRPDEWTGRWAVSINEQAVPWWGWLLAAALMVASGPGIVP